MSISITAEIDSLHARLLRSPTDRPVQVKLIDAYILSFNPELALLEILDAGNAADVKVKGLTQMSLEQIDLALQSLQEAYLKSPSDETLLQIALLSLARGDTGPGSAILQRLRSRTPRLSAEILTIYERFYLNNRRLIASAAALALREIDPVAYQSYFPHPQITILSPSPDYATEASQISVIFEVQHTRPMQLIRLQGSVLYDRRNEKSASPNEHYRQNFSTLIRLSEGANAIVAEATDIFGNKGSDTIVVSGLNFNRPPAWTSAESDSLRKVLQYFRNYLPDNVLVTEKSSAYRALIVSVSAAADSSEMFERGLFLHELLTNPVSGSSQASNVKLLVKNRVKSRNVSLVMKDWLLKGATFQSVSMLYLGGHWRISGQRWVLYDVNRDPFDVKPLLAQLRSLATSGVVVMIDGVIDQRDELVRQAQQLVQASTIPMEVLVLPAAGEWVQRTLRVLSPPRETVTKDADVMNFSTAYLEGLVPGSIRLASGSQSIRMARNPVEVVRRQHGEMLLLLQRKLAAEKAPSATKTKIVDFCRDWRRFHEMARFLSNDLTLSDFVVRVDEYRSRRQDAGRN